MKLYIFLLVVALMVAFFIYRKSTGKIRPGNRSRRAITMSEGNGIRRHRTGRRNGFSRTSREGNRNEFDNDSDGDSGGDGGDGGGDGD